ncbi:phosphatase PAP2 family protein [Aquibacillus kalidii]|uniref:phosphatase PAP2 family protein n=1 Tax=Aquibacillus kalidii TaxID=2762597 RepID=UPI001648B8AE|nr:phosphatase PAP2 family protein [Aquibacillus kalidii]
MKLKTKYFYSSFFLIALISSGLLTIRIIQGETPVIDVWSAPAVASIENSVTFDIFRWITELGSGSFLTPFTIFFSFFMWRYSKKWLPPVMIFSGILLGYRVNHWIKLIVERERPRIFAEAEGVGYSFPSGHAMVAIIAYGLFLYFLTKYTASRKAVLWINIIGIALILLIGFSRYVIQVHYLTDVLAGYMFGYMFLMIWIGIYHLINSFLKNTSPS